MFRLIFCMAGLISITAFGDIFERIEKCESRNGANGCIYDVMRELAARRGGGGGGGSRQLIPGQYVVKEILKGETSNFAEWYKISGINREGNRVKTFTWTMSTSKSDVFTCAGAECNGSSGNRTIVILGGGNIEYQQSGYSAILHKAGSLDDLGLEAIE